MNDPDVLIKQLRHAREKSKELKRGQAPQVEGKEKKKFDAFAFYLIDLALGLCAAAYVYFAGPQFSEKCRWVFKVEHFLFKIPYSCSWFEISFATGLFAMSVLYVMPVILVVIYDASQNKNNKTPKSEMDALYFRNLLLLSPALFGAAITYGIFKIPALFHRVLTVNVFYASGVIWIVMTGLTAYLMSLLLFIKQES